MSRKMKTPQNRILRKDAIPFSLLTVFLFLLPSCDREARFDSGPFLSGVFEERLLEIDEYDKPLLVFISDPECDPCRDMMQGINHDKKIIHYISENFLTLHYPDNVAGNEILPLVLEEYGYPKLLLIDTTFALRALLGGQIDPPLIRTLLDSALKNELFINYQPDLPWKAGKENAITEFFRAWHALYKRQSVSFSEHIRRSIDYYSYPFNQYLGIMDAVKTGDQYLVDSLTNIAIASYHKTALNDFLYTPLLISLKYASPSRIDSISSFDHPFAFQQTHYYGGRIKKNSSHEITIQYKNTGETADSIGEIIPSCDCMEVIHNNRLLMPGEENTIVLKYDTSRKGEFSKLIFIKNKSGKIMVVIIINGNIVE